MNWSPKPADCPDLREVAVVSHTAVGMYMVIPIGNGNWVASYEGKLIPQDGESRHAARDACLRHYNNLNNTALPKANT